MSGQVTIAELKAQAKQLRKRSANLGERLSHAQCLEQIAKSQGYRDWNECSAKVSEVERSRLAGHKYCIDTYEFKIEPFDFIDADMSSIKKHLDIEHLSLIVHETNSKKWCDFIWFPVQRSVLNKQDGFNIMYSSAEDKKAELLYFHDDGGREMLALMFLKSDIVDAVVRPSNPRLTERDAHIAAMAASSSAKDRSWAAREDTDFEIMVFADTVTTVLKIERGSFGKGLERVNRDEDERMKGKQPDLSVTDLEIGRVWHCAYRWENNPVPWNVGDEAIITKIDNDDLTIGILFPVTGLAIEIARFELLGGFQPGHYIPGKPTMLEAVFDIR